MEIGQSKPKHVADKCVQAVFSLPRARDQGRPGCLGFPLASSTAFLPTLGLWDLQVPPEELP